MKKKILLCAGVILVIASMVLGGMKFYRIHERDKVGILLAFDDYNAQNWESYFDLFDKYDVKVTFFVNAYEPTEFCYNAIDRGHEIAYHTASHVNLTEISQEEVYEQAIAPIEVFREKGIELVSFAYPYGKHNEELDGMLLEYYNVVRGAYKCEIYSKHSFRKGFVESYSLDNVNFDSDEMFEAKVMEILAALKAGKGSVISLYSHAISGSEWCIGEDRLEFLLQKAKEMGVEFYTFQELQDW